MEQMDFFDIPSPCTGVCTMDNRGYCQGCLRNREERFHWQGYSVIEKQQVIKRCQQRYRRRFDHTQKGNIKSDEPIQNPQRSLF